MLQRVSLQRVVDHGTRYTCAIIRIIRYTFESTGNKPVIKTITTRYERKIGNRHPFLTTDIRRINGLTQRVVVSQGIFTNIS